MSVDLQEMISPNSRRAQDLVDGFELPRFAATDSRSWFESLEEQKPWKCSAVVISRYKSEIPRICSLTGSENFPCEPVTSWSLVV